jgi:FkbH-like protein
MKILISGSSFLLPKNKAWNSLAKKNNIEFVDYGNWSGSLLQAKPEDILILVIFLDDLIDLRSRDLADLQVILKNFYNLLENHLNRAKLPTIVCFASGQEYDVIRSSKIPNQKEIARNTFFDEAWGFVHQYQQLYLIDLDRLLGRLEKNQAYDQRNWYLAHCRLSSRGLSVLSDGVSDILQRVSEPASKVLVLDCDNTLWGGVIGEDGIEGLVLGQDGLGQAYVDFQLAIKELSSQGAIVVLASKNNEDEVWEVFDNHRSMVLARSDIVSWKINWDEKFENIQALADELDLSMDAFVFWDDNPVEREKMRLMLPQVFTVDTHADVFEWPNQLSQLVHFAKFSITKDDLKKTEQYQSRAKFVREKKEVLDEESYLKTIQLKPAIEPINSATISRAEQVCAKTNQFNLRTIRHTAADLQQLAQNNPDLCFLISLSDVYGDHGIVGLVCMRELDKQTLFLDTFLQSCRVLGRHLESWMLQHALNVGRHHGYATLVGEFIPTKRNKIAADFLEAHGFEPLHSTSCSECDTDSPVKIQDEALSSGPKRFIRSLSKSNLPFVDVYEKS